VDTRVVKEMHKKKVVAVSGGFDPIHVGHVRMFTKARALGDELVVILNNDNWLRAKKGFVFMPEKERKALLEALVPIDRVIITGHKEKDPDRSVSRELRKLKPSIFANGGDRRSTADIPEEVVCQNLGIEMIFNIGGGKVQSSSWLTDSIRMAGVQMKRPWGAILLFARGKNFWMKTLSVNPGGRTSLQSHTRRREQWMCVEGEVVAEVGPSVKKLKKRILRPGDNISFDTGALHRLSSKRGGTIVEVVYGDPDEDDIVRYEDDYGRA